MLPLIQQTDLTLDISANKVAGKRFISRNIDVDGLVADEDIINFGGLYSFPAAAETLGIVSTDAADNSGSGTGAKTITIYGLDANYAEISEVITLHATDGTVQVSSIALFLRVSHVEVTTTGASGTNEGAITVDNNTSSDILGRIEVAENFSDMCQYTIPANKDGWIASIKGVMMTAAQTGVISIYVTPNGGTESELDFLPLGSTEHSKIWIHVDEETDIVLRSSASADNTDIKGSFELFVL